MCPRWKLDSTVESTVPFKIVWLSAFPHGRKMLVLRSRNCVSPRELENFDFQSPISGGVPTHVTYLTVFRLGRNTSRTPWSCTVCAVLWEERWVARVHSWYNVETMSLVGYKLCYCGLCPTHDWVPDSSLGVELGASQSPIMIHVMCSCVNASQVRWEGRSRLIVTAHPVGAWFCVTGNWITKL